MRRSGFLVLLVLAAATPAPAISVEKLLGGGRLAAYRPRESGAAGPSARALRTDAESLWAVGFRAATTYGTSRLTVPVCRFFKRAGFRTVLVGIADPGDPAEIRRAVRQKRCADGYVVGSEGLAAGRYGRDDLERAIATVRAASGRPVTTRETLETLAGDASLVRAGDWVFPTIHPWRAGKRDSQDACGWTIFAYRDLAEAAPAGVATVIAETGLPTEGDAAASEHYQRALFMCLESRLVPFGYFEAFDRAPADGGGVEAHWGLFRADGAPKLWAAQQIHATIGAERAGDLVRGRVGDGPRHLLQVVAYVKRERWEALPAIVPDRRGAWQATVPRDRPVAVFVTSLAWAPPSPVDRLPAVDRARVLATRELPPL